MLMVLHGGEAPTHLGGDLDPPGCALRPRDLDAAPARAGAPTPHPAQVEALREHDGLFGRAGAKELFVLVGQLGVLPEPAGLGLGRRRRRGAVDHLSELGAAQSPAYGLVHRERRGAGGRREEEQREETIQAINIPMRVSARWCSRSVRRTERATAKASQAQSFRVEAAG